MPPGSKEADFLGILTKTNSRTKLPGRLRGWFENFLTFASSGMEGFPSSKLHHHESPPRSDPSAASLPNTTFGQPE